MTPKDKLLISPNKLVICQIGKIVEINKAAFGAKYFFLDIHDKVLYKKKNTYLHELKIRKEGDSQIEEQNNLKFKLLQWSNDGNSVYFLEYSFENRNLFYWSTIIDFKEKKIYRINENENHLRIVNELSISEAPFNISDVKSKLVNEQIFADFLSGCP
jgi:hypothetical protein